jgi:lysophospholipase L1-like esterase
MAYTFDAVFAVDPNNPANIAKNASITIFDPADPTQAPIAITDPTGVPLPNPMTLDAAGMGPAYQHATLARVGWKGAGFVGYFTSYEGMFNETVAAKEAAQAAVSEAATAGADAAAVASAALAGAVADAEAASTAAAASAALVGAPADTAIAAAINGTGTATKTALSATYATKAELADLPVGGETGGPASIPAFGVGTVPLPRFYAGVRRVWNGTGHCKVLAVGDSTSYGVGTTGGIATGSYPGKMVQLINDTIAPATIGLAKPQNWQTDTADTRFAAGSGWTGYALGFAAQSAYRAAPTATGSLTYTPTTTVDTFDIFLAKNTTLGTATIQATGGTAVVVDCAGPVGIIKVTVTCPAAASPVLSITRTAGNDLYFLAVDSYLSTRPAIRVGNAGASAAKTTGWVDNTSVLSSLNTLRTYAPDLTVISLGINDTAPTAVTVAQWTTNMRTLIRVAQESGDVIIMSVVPSQDLSRAAIEAQYATAGKALAVETGCIFIDLFARFGSWVDANAKGWMADPAHPNAAGYAIMADMVQRTLALSGSTPTDAAAILDTTSIMRKEVLALITAATGINPDSLMTDTFTGTDAQLLTLHTPEIGGAWTVPVGSWEIQGNKARATVNGSTALVNVGTKNVAVELKLTYAAISQTVIINSNSTGADYYAAQFTGTNIITIQKRAAGVTTNHSTHTVATFNAGQTYKLKAVRKDSLLSVYLDGVLLTTINGDTVTPSANGTYIGMLQAANALGYMESISAVAS